APDYCAGAAARLLCIQPDSGSGSTCDHRLTEERLHGSPPTVPATPVRTDPSPVALGDVRAPDPGHGAVVLARGGDRAPRIRTAVLVRHLHRRDTRLRRRDELDVPAPVEPRRTRGGRTAGRGPRQR